MLARMRSWLMVCVVAAAAQGACSAEGAVSLTGTVGSVSVAVEHKPPFVTELAGKFDVFLELGPRAPSSTEVSFTAFSLVRADTGASALPTGNLSVLSDEPSPFSMDPGAKKSVVFEIGSARTPDGKAAALQLTTQEGEELCVAGQLQVVVTLKASAMGDRATTVMSPPFELTGCNR